MHTLQLGKRSALTRAMIVSLTGALLTATSLSAFTVPSSAQDTAVSSPDMGVSKTLDVVAAAQALLSEFTSDTVAQIQFPFPTTAPSEASFARTPSAQSSGTPPADASAPPADATVAGGQGTPPAGAQGNRPGGGQNMAFIGEQYGDAVWSNYPVSDVPRSGVQLGDMSDTQRAAAMTLLQTVLSPDGYQKVLDVLGSDQALSDQGQNFASGEDVYTIGILGTPSATDPWMIAFTGHHLGLNVVIYGAHGIMTPTLTGAQPAIYTNAAGDTVRVLAGENDTAFALLDALTEEQRGQAVLDYTVSDLVAGPGKVGQTIVPEGLKASDMTEEQQSLLLDIVAQWAGIVDPAYAEPRMQEITEGLADTYFAWSGPTTHEADHNGTSYYRIQGPKLIIEFSPQGVGGDPTMHVHTMYRDPTNDYGLALTTP